MKRAEALSCGQQQRVAIARALMKRPKFVLADKRIASLDPMSALDTAHRYRVIGMRAGRIVFEGASELLSQDVTRIYGAGAEFSEASTSTGLDWRPAPRRDPGPRHGQTPAPAAQGRTPIADPFRESEPMNRFVLAAAVAFAGAARQQTSEVIDEPASASSAAKMPPFACAPTSACARRSRRSSACPPSSSPPRTTTA